MPTQGFSVLITLGLLSAGAMAVFAAPQSAQPTPPGSSEESGYVLKVTSRLVTLDLIATDSQGKAVRDLKPEELQVFEKHNARQKIAQFELIDKGAGGGGPAARRPGDFYSNQVTVEGLKIPPTVLLMDGLNTETAYQMQGRLHLLRLLKSLPPDTPVAVFLLGHSLKVLQGLTHNGSLLQAAVDRALSANEIAPDPADDPNSVSNSMSSVLNSGGDQESSELGNEVLQDIEDFEKEQYADSMDLRVRQTLEALTSIANYLSGIPGRKNLVWVSEAFPFAILPSTDTGRDPSAGTRDYSQPIAAAANALTDAQVSVYPIDIRGLEPSQAFAASQTQVGRLPSGRQTVAQLNREQGALFQTQGTMEELAKDTGGKTCKNTNDLSGCVERVFRDSSVYYELGFYPQNVAWDGSFHELVVKTSRPGVQLTYRRGYFAVDAAALAKTQPVEDRLRQGCLDALPSTALRFTAQAVRASASSIPAARGEFQYLLSISTEGLGLSQGSGLRNLSLLLAICEFGEKDSPLRFNARDLTDVVNDQVFHNWQEGGTEKF